MQSERFTNSCNAAIAEAVGQGPGMLLALAESLSDLHSTIDAMPLSTLGLAWVRHRDLGGHSLRWRDGACPEHSAAAISRQSDGGWDTGDGGLIESMAMAKSVAFASFKNHVKLVTSALHCEIKKGASDLSSVPLDAFSTKAVQVAVSSLTARRVADLLCGHTAQPERLRGSEAIFATDINGRMVNFYSTVPFTAADDATSFFLRGIRTSATIHRRTATGPSSAVYFADEQFGAGGRRWCSVDGLSNDDFMTNSTAISRLASVYCGHGWK